MRRGLPIVLCVVIAATAAAVALAQQVGNAPRPQAAAISASGSFGISSSHDGQPIFAAGGIAPGGSARGTVAIEDTGAGPVALTLSRGELIDTPGLGAGVLSERLQLTVVDVTAPAAPKIVYSGPLATMPAQPAGKLEPGAVRTFEFTATLPADGTQTFQNAVQGASATVAYSWIAGEASGEEGGAKEESSGGGGSVGGGGSSGGDQNGSGGKAAEDAVLRLTVPRIRRALRRDRLIVWTNCDESCRLYVRGRMRATSTEGPDRGHHRGARIRFSTKSVATPGPRQLRIPVPPRLRRWMREDPGRERLRAKLRFVAVGLDGQRDAVRETVRLRAGRR
jgi:hypothetical protein